MALKHASAEAGVAAQDGERSWLSNCWCCTQAPMLAGFFARRTNRLDETVGEPQLGRFDPQPTEEAHIGNVHTWGSGREYQYQGQLLECRSDRCALSSHDPHLRLWVKQIKRTSQGLVTSLAAVVPSKEAAVADSSLCSPRSSVRRAGCPSSSVFICRSATASSISLCACSSLLGGGGDGGADGGVEGSGTEGGGGGSAGGGGDGGGGDEGGGSGRTSNCVGHACVLELDRYQLDIWAIAARSSVALPDAVPAYRQLTATGHSSASTPLVRPGGKAEKAWPMQCFVTFVCHPPGLSGQPPAA
eukprot:762017-Prymnesium_polylepis.1